MPRKQHAELLRMTFYCRCNWMGLRESASGSDTLLTITTETPHYPLVAFPLTPIIDLCTKTRLGIYNSISYQNTATCHRDSGKVWSITSAYTILDQCYNTVYKTSQWIKHVIGARLIVIIHTGGGRGVMKTCIHTASHTYNLVINIKLGCMRCMVKCTPINVICM